MKCRPELLIDGYKLDHHHQYPKNTQLIFSNFTPRFSRRGAKDIVFFGLQYFIKEYLIEKWAKDFFEKPWGEIEESFINSIRKYLGKYDIDTCYLYELWRLGYLPIEIMAVPEGTIHEIKVPPLVIFNTDPRFPWLVNYLETLMSCTLWGACTSATTALEYKKILLKAAFDTNKEFIDFVDFQAHDFSMRGMFGLEAACISGAAHLTCFKGTDTLPAIDFIEQYYPCDESELIAMSVPATEHSVMCAGGKENELQTIKCLISDIYPDGIISIVSDTWDFWNVITTYATELKDIILERNGKVVFRPDSGDPVKILCGSFEPINFVDLNDKYSLADAVKAMRDYLHNFVSCNTPHGTAGVSEIRGYFIYADIKYQIDVGIDWNRYDKKYYYIDDAKVLNYKEYVAPSLAAHEKGAVEVLWDIFGGDINKDGYKVLNKHVGLIYGDSITLERAALILEKLKLKGFASTNVVLGIGSYTYQHVTRDTDGYAMKATYAEIDGIPVALFKDPKTDDGIKKSAKGLLAVYPNIGAYSPHEKPAFNHGLKEDATWDEVRNCELQTVFKDGKLLKEISFAQIRKNISTYLKEKIIM